MDIVYILRPWYDNCLELRFSLRSLANIKHDKVFIVGYKPEWCENVIHIPAEDPYSVKSLNALHKITIACEDKRISDDFILMNDDFYICKPTEIKYYNQWTIEEHLQDKINRLWNSKYIQNIRKTLNIFPEWLDFSLHIPIIYNKEKFLKLWDKYDKNEWYLLRNLYCNEYWVKSEYRQDYKIRNLKELVKDDQTFISNDDALIVNEEFREYLYNKFPNVSKYEHQDIEDIKIINLFHNIKPMELKWRPWIVINRFWKSYKSNDEWIIIAETQEELDIFKAYWFKEQNNIEILEKESNIYEEYEAMFGKKVPNNKKNDIIWIKEKLWK